MKVKIIKSLRVFNKEWKKHIGKIYDAIRSQHFKSCSGYWVKINNEDTFWYDEEVEEIT